MGEKRAISVEISNVSENEDLKELEDKKARIIINILREKYGDIILEQYISNIRGKREDYS